MSPARSWLFVPATRPDRFERARSSGADRVIVDLEDAVSPDDKDAARASIAAWLAPERPVFVRVNGSETDWFASDVAAVRRPGLAGIVLPKAQDTAAIRHVARALAPLAGATILPLVETARGLWLARRLARAAPVVERLAIGTLDLALDLDMAPDDDEREMMFARAQIVMASRLAGVAAPIDGICAGIDDLERLTTASAAARRMGFGGKLAIHPRQIATIHAAFAPRDDEIAWARRVMDAATQAPGGVVRVDGVMVDRPLVERARRVLDAGDRGQGAGDSS